MILETDRLILRPFELRDAPMISELAGHADVAATTLNMPHPYPEAAAESFIQSLRDRAADDPNITLAIVRKIDDQFMGGISMRPVAQFDHADIGYWIGVPYWNQGYASEAARRIIDYGFAELGLHRIYAAYFVHNLASRRVMEKAGMTYEGTLRQHVKRFDQYHDLGYCGILRDEWEARRPRPS